MVPLRRLVMKLYQPHPLDLLCRSWRR
ncbi:hypothetical protein NC652_001475 [Populus alba x Populus x berolinensis]|uniref:Uncharacterized protein n=1 Tax=Populus alba x Populus x berolinensis TaxID=444605 RepID=A0AAD6RMK0_9ROSI|nr:hypothetical protein NC652_001475 [Populus alba x Populus x berolinensis]KAJ7011095.1 hypothetical protein NC653_001506 [Populus alba x Populus x berolinensis]